LLAEEFLKFMTNCWFVAALNTPWIHMEESWVSGQGKGKEAAP
jgi:hypothetical protein